MVDTVPTWIPVTLEECRAAIEQAPQDPEYLLLLLGWAVAQLSSRSEAEELPTSLEYLWAVTRLSSRSKAEELPTSLEYLQLIAMLDVDEIEKGRKNTSDRKPRNFHLDFMLPALEGLSKTNLRRIAIALDAAMAFGALECIDGNTFLTDRAAMEARYWRCVMRLKG
jgi:hypothetical protein